MCDTTGRHAYIPPYLLLTNKLKKLLAVREAYDELILIYAVLKQNTSP